MTLPSNYNDRVGQSFLDAGTGKTAQRVVLSGAGSETPSAGVFTLVSSVGSAAWVALPTTNQTNRVTMAIQNQGSVDCKLNFVNTVGVTDGWNLAAGAEFFIDLAAGTTIYARTATSTTNLGVIEVAQ